MIEGRTCEGCGAEFRREKRSRDARRFCSRQCAFSHKANAWNRGRVSVRRFHCIYPLSCGWCAKVFIGRSSKAKFCSPICARHGKALYMRLRSAAKKDQALRLCLHCGRLFSRSYGNKFRVFCGPYCGRRHARKGMPKNAMSRARKFGVARDGRIRSIAVFERDLWRCQLCGRSTPKRLRGTQEPSAPELDHIVPLSRGGGHVWENVQCACRECNSRKGAKPLGQQRLTLWPR